LAIIAAQKRGAFLFWDKYGKKRENVTILTSPGGVSGFLRRLHLVNAIAYVLRRKKGDSFNMRKGGKVGGKVII